MTTKTPPHWDLSNVYPSLASPKFIADVKKLEKSLAEMEKFADSTLAKVDEKAFPTDLAKAASSLISILAPGDTPRIAWAHSSVEFPIRNTRSICIGGCRDNCVRSFLLPGICLSRGHFRGYSPTEDTFLSWGGCGPCRFS